MLGIPVAPTRRSRWSSSRSDRGSIRFTVFECDESGIVWQADRSLVWQAVRPGTELTKGTKVFGDLTILQSNQERFNHTAPVLQSSSSRLIPPSSA